MSTPVLKKTLQKGDVVYFATSPKIVDETKIRGLQNKVEKLTFYMIDDRGVVFFEKENGSMKKFYDSIKGVLFKTHEEAELDRRRKKVSVMNQVRKNIDKELKRLSKLDVDLINELDKEIQGL